VTVGLLPSDLVVTVMLGKVIPVDCVGVELWLAVVRKVFEGGIVIVFEGIGGVVCVGIGGGLLVSTSMPLWINVMVVEPVAVGAEPEFVINKVVLGSATAISVHVVLITLEEGITVTVMWLTNDVVGSLVVCVALIGIIETRVIKAATGCMLKVIVVELSPLLQICRCWWLS
jgi:hypothetical protein